ncbi:hypothetical protein BOTBODRAFT_293418 [Botryobasidium botryosum FD-172 SS1]|uniref:FAD-binding domain-containing protein n=1 Tax=Botryobasidium botryosum (strain FD-172 SS1) TaxID=930990 RepID=A0A067MUF3_BOTB1|nr:hypothetical protein BOTBODRAFT_293418 [Botryobasidium botryosum FD-172 SS1]
MSIALVCKLIAAPVFAYLLFECVWALLRRRAIRRTTALDDLPHLGETHPQGRMAGRAVIAGGSLAGFAAANVCANFFEEVLIVEPDALLEGKRARVGQVRQLHSFQSMSLLVLRKLFPGFDDAARKAGARILPMDLKIVMGGDTMRFDPASPLPRSVFTSRQNLETLIRDLTLLNPRIKLIQGTVIGVKPSSDGSRITSVLVRGASKDEPIQSYSAALLADCTGASRAGLKWLEKASPAWGRLKKAVIYDPRAIYATAIVPFPHRLRKIWPAFQMEGYEGGYDELGFLKALNPGLGKDTRISAVLRIDGDRLMLCSGGWGLDISELPATVDDIIQHMDEQYRNAFDGREPEKPVMDSLKMLKVALEEDNTPVQFENFRIGPAFFIDYTTARSLPANYVALGDAVVRVNPVYGQGVTKLMIDAATLNGVLLETSLTRDASGDLCLPAGFSKAFFAKQYPRVKHMFEDTKAQDYGFPTTQPSEGEQLGGGELQLEMFNELLRIGHEDRRVATKIWLAIQGVAPGIDLQHPKLLTRVVWRFCKKRLFGTK